MRGLVGVLSGIHGMRMMILLISFRLGKCLLVWVVKEAVDVCSCSAQDLKSLWNDPAVREYLALNRYKLEHLPGL